jgi:CheY-like chemotaxis protein
MIERAERHPVRGPVLVVDDEADLAANYERILRRLGYRVVAVGTRGCGLAALALEAPRLVVADLRLPDGDGLDIVRAARALPASPPVLVATVYGSSASRRAALAAGATAFLAKPFPIDTFSRVVNELMAAKPC